MTLKNELHIGDVVTFVDEDNEERPALVIMIWGDSAWEEPTDAPTINLVTVAKNTQEAPIDEYGTGRRIMTSVVAKPLSYNGEPHWKK